VPRKAETNAAQKLKKCYTTTEQMSQKAENTTTTI